jgi:flavin-dependent dehydrogenase
VESTDVAVVGAGVAGSAAAILLARAGASVTLVNRAAHRPDPGQGIILGPADWTCSPRWSSR